jgi:hypothetical protein
VDVVGDERHLFGALLLAMGYVMLRWVFRRSSGRRAVRGRRIFGVSSRRLITLSFP